MITIRVAGGKTGTMNTTNIKPDEILMAVGVERGDCYIDGMKIDKDKAIHSGLLQNVTVLVVPEIKIMCPYCEDTHYLSDNHKHTVKTRS